jgi:hypothetical protein
VISVEAHYNRGTPIRDRGFLLESNHDHDGVRTGRDSAQEDVAGSGAWLIPDGIDLHIQDAFAPASRITRASSRT